MNAQVSLPPRKQVRWFGALVSLSVGMFAVPAIAKAQIVELQCEVSWAEQGVWRSGRSFGPNTEQRTYRVRIDPAAAKAALVYPDGSGSWHDLSISEAQYSFCDAGCPSGDGPITISRTNGAFRQTTRSPADGVVQSRTITQTGDCARYEGPIF